MKNVRLVIVSALAGAVLATSATAFAGPVTSKISVLLRPDYTVTVNGKQIKKAPINYDGTTYLPLREISDAFGAQLDLQGKAIAINSKEAASVPILNTSSEYISIRDLVELLNKKYPGAGVTLRADGRLTLGDKDYQLDVKYENDWVVFLKSEIVEKSLLSNQDF